MIDKRFLAVMWLVIHGVSAYSCPAIAQPDVVADQSYQLHARAQDGRPAWSWLSIMGIPAGSGRVAAQLSDADFADVELRIPRKWRIGALSLMMSVSVCRTAGEGDSQCSKDDRTAGRWRQRGLPAAGYTDTSSGAVRNAEGRPLGLGASARGLMRSKSVANSVGSAPAGMTIETGNGFVRQTGGQLAARLGRTVWRFAANSGYRPQGRSVDVMGEVEAALSRGGDSTIELGFLVGYLYHDTREDWVVADQDGPLVGFSIRDIRRRASNLRIGLMVDRETGGWLFHAAASRQLANDLSLNVVGRAGDGSSTDDLFLFGFRNDPQLQVRLEWLF